MAGEGHVTAFTESDIQELAQDLIQITSKQGTEESIKPSWEEIQQAASKFLFQIRMLDELYERQEMLTIQNIMRGDPDSASANFLLRGSNKLSKIRSQFLLAFDFDAKITKFRGQLPRRALIVYEYKDDQGNKHIQSQEYSLEELAAHITSGMRINQNSFQLMKESDTKEADIVKQNKEMEEHLKQVQAAYFGASNRLDQFYKARNKTIGSTYINAKGHTVQRQNQGGLLMWIENSEWMVEKVSNAGDLKEAYASALLKECRTEMTQLCVLCSVDPGSPPFQSHDLINKFAHDYIFEVTNKAEVLEADVKGRDAQYDIKSGKAQAPHLNQYIEMAEHIIKGEISEKTIEDDMAKWFPQDAHRNAIYNMNEIVDGTIQDIMHQTIERISN